MRLTCGFMGRVCTRRRISRRSCESHPIKGPGCAHRSFAAAPAKRFGGKIKKRSMCQRRYTSSSKNILTINYMDMLVRKDQRLVGSDPKYLDILRRSVDAAKEIDRSKRTRDVNDPRKQNPLNVLFDFRDLANGTTTESYDSIVCAVVNDDRIPTENRALVVDAAGERLVREYFRHGRIREGSELLFRALQPTERVPDLHPHKIHRAVVEELWKSDRSSFATSLLRLRSPTSSDGGDPSYLANREIFNRLIHLWIRLSREDRAASPLFATKGRAQLASATYDLMASTGVSPDINTYNGLIKFCFGPGRRDRDRPRRAFAFGYDFFLNMLESGVKPTNTTIITLFDAAATSNEVRRIERDVFDDVASRIDAKEERGSIGRTDDRVLLPTHSVGWTGRRPLSQPAVVAWCRALLRTGNHLRTARVMRSFALFPESLELLATTKCGDAKALYIGEEALLRAAATSTPSIASVAIVVERLVAAGYLERAESLLEKLPLPLLDEGLSAAVPLRKRAYRHSLRALSRLHASRGRVEAFDVLLRRARDVKFQDNLSMDASSLNVVVEAATALGGASGAIRCLNVLSGTDDDVDSSRTRSLPMSEKMLCGIIRELKTVDDLENACERLLPFAVVHHGVVPMEQTKRALVDLTARIADANDVPSSSLGASDVGMSLVEASEVASVWWPIEDEGSSTSVSPSRAPASVAEHLCTTAIDAAIDLVEPIARTAKAGEEHAAQEIEIAVRTHFEAMFGMVSAILPEWNPSAILSK